MQYRITSKLLFFENTIWRRVFFIKNKIFIKATDKFIMSRSSNIPSTYLNFNIKIYNGKKWINRSINRWRVGFKFGELTWNRKIAVYKMKQLKKKKK